MIITADLHVHSNLSDGKLSVKELVDYYGSRGINAMAITDHAHDRFRFITKENFNIYVKQIEQNIGYARKKYNMLLIPGLEVTSDLQGFHIICIPAKEYISPNIPMEEVLKRIKEMDCFSIACHPNKKNTEYPTTKLWDERKKINKFVDAWEIFNRDEVLQYDELDNNIVFVAGSDFHEPGKHDMCWRMRLDADELSVEGIISGIKSKKVQPFVGFPRNF